ncbi:uncharacterized protein LOC144599252 isoform X2 [Rhinoraja longicauda]
MRHLANNYQLKFVQRPDDITDDEPGVFRVELSCGHATDPISFTEWCRSLMDQGHMKFHCPASAHGTNGKCNKEWSYQEVRTCALLSVEERQVFEEKLGLLSAAKYCEYKQIATEVRIEPGSLVL